MNIAFKSTLSFIRHSMLSIGVGSFFLLLMTIIPTEVQAQFACSGSIYCAIEYTVNRCVGGDNAGSDCSGSSDCPYGECKTFTEEGGGDGELCSSDGRECRADCSEGRQLGGGCRIVYPPPPPPPPAPVKYKCVGTQCTQASDGTYTSTSCGGACNPATPPPAPPPPEPETCGPSNWECTQDAQCGDPDLYDCNNYCCVNQTGGGASDCSYHNSWGITWMRFRSVEEDGSVRYWKGPQSIDPVRSNSDKSYWPRTDVRDQNWSVDPDTDGGLDAEGYFKVFRAYDDFLSTNRNRAFDKSVNRIDSEMNVIVETDLAESYGANECGGTKTVSGTASDPVNRIPLSPAAPDHWSNHFCATGRALGPDAAIAGKVPGLHPDEDNKLRYGRKVEHDNYTITRTDYDGCTNFFLLGKKVLASDKRDGSTTGYWEELRNQLVRSSFQSVWPDLRYDNYWSMSYAPWRKWQNAPVRSFVYVRPPNNYECSTAYLGNNVIAPESNDKYPDYCRYIYTPGETNMLLVNFVRNEINFCQTDIGGFSDAIINTNISVNRSTLPVTSSSFSNNTNIQTSLRMSPIQTASSFPVPSKYNPAAALFTSMFTQANYLNRYYYRFNQVCKTTDSSQNCLIGSSPRFNAADYDYAINTTSNAGVYYAFCQMEEFTDTNTYVGPVCTGSTYCIAEGGTVDCEDANNPSCSESSGGALEEIAMSINVPFYRRCRYNQDGVPTGCTAWQPGPFDYGDETKLDETSNGTINAIGLADYLNPSDGLNYTTYIRYIDDVQYYTVLPNEKHGFPKWELLRSKTASGQRAPAGESVTAYTIKYIPTADRFFEEIWREKNGTTTHYVRTINRTGTRPQLESTTPWTAQSIAITNLANASLPVAAHGSYILPKSSGSYNIWESIYQNNASGGFSARSYRSAPWSPTAIAWPTQAQFSPWTEASWDSKPDVVFAGTTLPKRMEAYDAHYIPNAGTSDKARLVYQCLDNCSACSNGEQSGCGGTVCPISPLIGETLTAPTTWTISNWIEASKVLFLNNVGQTTMTLNNFSALTGDSRYDIMVFPISTTEAANPPPITSTTKSADIATQYLTTPLLTSIAAGETSKVINLADPLLSGKSPIMRVMVQTCNICGCSAWSYKDVFMRSMLTVDYRELGTNTCPSTPSDAVPDLNTAPLATFGTNVSTAVHLNTLPFLIKFPLTLPGSSVTVRRTNDGTGGWPDERRSATQSIVNLWYAPPEWFPLPREGRYNVQAPIDQLNANGYALACGSPDGLVEGVDAPSVVHFYLERAFDAWWRTMGGLVATEDGAIESLIPTTCQDDSACVDILVGANPYVARTTPAQTAGLAIAGGDETLSANAGRYSQNFGDPHAQGDVTIQPPYNYAYFKAKIEKAGLELRGDWNQLRTGGPLSVPAQEYNSVPYYIWHVVPGASDSTLQIDPAKWALGNEKVIILVETSMAFSSTGPATNLITIGSGGYLLVAAQDNLYFENSIGRVMDASIPVNDATPVLSGLFIADNFLTIADSGDPDDIIKDNQFVGKGTFVGYEDVVLERKFDDGSSGRTLNNLQPAELFVHDPQLMLNTPEFLKDPVIQFMEIQ